MTGWDVFTDQVSVPAGMLAELAALRAALPGYDVILTSHSPVRRYEAICRTNGPGPWCVVSTDPVGLWRELAGRAPPAAPGSDEPDRVLLLAARTIGSHPAARVPPLESAKARSTAK